MNLNETGQYTMKTLETRFAEGEFDEAYAEFIMLHSVGSERVVCNGDALIDAMEAGYLADEFLDYLANVE
jgi:hypothetical protein